MFNLSEFARFRSPWFRLTNLFTPDIYYASSIADYLSSQVAMPWLVPGEFRYYVQINSVDIVHHHAQWYHVSDSSASTFMFWGEHDLFGTLVQPRNMFAFELFFRHFGKVPHVVSARNGPKESADPALSLVLQYVHG